MTRASWSVAVLVSAGRHPETGASRACRGDAIAMALGRKMAGDALRVVHAGGADEAALKDYLALGAATLEVVPVSSHENPISALSAHLKDVDVILTGTRAETGAGSGLLPYALAAALNRPVIANVLSARIERQDLRIEQFLPKGRRRSIASPLNSVLSVHPLAPVSLNYAFARQQSGRISLARPSTTAVQPVVLDTSAAWSVEHAPRRPVRLKAEETKSGHARMLSAVAPESKGGSVAIEGSSVEKAQMLLAYLRDNRLIDF